MLIPHHQAEGVVTTLDQGVTHLHGAVPDIRAAGLEQALAVLVHQGPVHRQGPVVDLGHQEVTHLHGAQADLEHQGLSTHPHETVGGLQEHQRRIPPAKRALQHW